jgi:hypothetical protein
MKIKLVVLALGLVLFCQFTHAQVPSYVPTNGLVGYWPFNGNANDESGNGNNGANNGAALTSDRFGNNNTAFYFDGEISYIDILNNSSLNFTSNNKITISFWMYSTVPPTANLARVLISKQNGSGANQIGFNVSYEPQSTYLLVGNGVSNAYSYVDGNLLGVGVWHNLVLVYDNGITKSYKNGILINEGFAPSIIGASTQSLKFGKPTWTALNASGFKGNIDDIGIWNRALTQEEIVGLFNAQSNTCETLVINSGPLSFNPPTYASTVNIYPNPANDQITIDCGNLANVSGWSIKIVNAIGQEVFTGEMNTQQYVVPLNSWSGQGLYFVKIYDALNNLVNTKKIILQ